jgi:hypothetical protein
MTRARDIANFGDGIDASSITSGTFPTANIADDAITLAKMASGTDGQIITYDASGNPSAVGPGTDGQVLTSTGAGSPPAFEDASGGAWVKLEEKTASGQTTIEMGSSTLLSSSYDLYCIKFVNFSVSASGSNVYGRFNVGGILSAGSYRFSTATWRSDVDAILRQQSHSGTSFYMGYAMNDSVEVTGSCHATGFVYLPQPYSTSKLKQAFGTCAISEDESNRVSHSTFVASYNTSSAITTALTEFQFLLSGSGNISAGKFVLYGIKD